MVRFAKAEDMGFLKHAWKVCFNDPDEFIKWNFSENFCLGDTIVAEVDKTPASNMQLMPHTIDLRGISYPINYVSGVATLPEFRMRGLVREMFEFAFPEMHKRNQPISILVPFNYEFYEKFGYKKCYNKVFRYIDILPEREYLTYENLTEKDIEDINRIYLSAMEDKTGYVIRNRETWRRILEDLLITSKGYLYFHQTDGIRDGYALLTSFDKGGYEIHEALGECDLDFRAEEKPFAMARIVDAKRVLEDLARDFKGSARIKIIDHNIPENNLVLSIENGKVTPSDDYDTEIDIKDLATAVFGFNEKENNNTYINLIF